MKGWFHFTFDLVFSPWTLIWEYPITVNNCLQKGWCIISSTVFSCLFSWGTVGLGNSLLWWLFWRGRQWERFHPSTGSLPKCTCWDCTWLKPGARNSAQVSHATWMSGTQLLGPSPASSQGLSLQNIGVRSQGLNLGIVIWNEVS